jgi:hypothetical protein
MREIHFGRLAQGLIDNTIYFRQAQKRSQLILWSICVKVEMNPNTLKPNLDKRCRRLNVTGNALSQVSFGLECDQGSLGLFFITLF